MELSDDETIVLYEALQYQYISYENLSFLELVRRIRVRYMELKEARKNELQK